jgi:putative copper export protein/mono/diheme cytochrome c family protein
MTATAIIATTLRGVHVTALVSLFGTLLFITVLADDVRLLRVLRRVARISAVCALLAGLAWLIVESSLIAGADSVAATLRAAPVVAFQTHYGRWFVVRCALLAVVVVLPFGRRAALVIALALAGVVLALQPLLGHAGAIGGVGGAELIASETLHLLAAGAWLGGLLPLFIAVRMLPHEGAATACRGFTPIGLAAVLLLAGTAVVQVVELMGGLPGLFGTSYGHVALVKLALFFVLLSLAGLNRLVLTERLARDPSGAAQWHMSLSILCEAVLGVAVIVAAGLLASLTPGTHEQPVWPFPWRPSMAAFEDPSLRRGLILALVTAGIGIVAAVAGLIWRRFRREAFFSGLVILVLALSELNPLFIEAYPTSFFTSPTEFAATAIVHGAKLFVANCAICHGLDARGDGMAAKSLPVPPADLTAEHLWMHNDGELYWYVAHGAHTSSGGAAMPGFEGTLSSEAIWDLIDYLHAHNAGESMRLTRKWSHPLPVPQFDAVCPNGREVDLDDLRGKVLRIVADSDEEQSEPNVDASTIFLVRHHTAKANRAACVNAEPEAWVAFAIILGRSPDDLAGWTMLADQNAWLRAAWHPGEADDWNDPRVLTAVIRNIMTHPLVIVGASGHVHQR